MPQHGGVAVPASTAVPAQLTDAAEKAQKAEQDRIEELLQLEDLGQLSDAEFGAIARMRTTGDFPPAISGGGFGARLKFSFLRGSPQQQLNFLQRLYGQARPTAKGFEFLDPKTKQFKLFDPEGAELGDIADAAGDIPGLALSLLGTLTAAPIAGSGLGFAIGEAASTAVGQVIEPDPNLDPATDIGRTGLTNLGIGAAFEAVPAGIKKTFQKAVAPFAKQVNPVALATSKEFGIKALPSELIDEQSVAAFLLRSAEKVLESTVTGGAPVRALKSQRLTNITIAGDAAADIAAKLVDPSTLKVMVTDIINASHSAFKSYASGLFNKLGRVAREKEVKSTLVQTAEGGLVTRQSVGESVIDNRLVNKFARRELDRIPAGARIAARKGGAEASALSSQLERIAKLPDQLSFGDAQFYRSQLLTTVRNDKKVATDNVIRVAKRTAELLRRRMQEAARKGGFLPEFEKALAVYEEGIKPFQSAFIRGMAERKPEDIAKNVYQSIETIRVVKEVIDEPTFRRIQRAFIEDLNKSGREIAGAGGQGEPFFTAQTVLTKWNALSEEIKREGFAPEVRAAYEKFLNFAVRTPTVPAGVGFWGMSQVVRGVQIGTAQVLGAAGLGVAGFSIGGVPGALVGASSAFLGPLALSKMITSRIGRKLLTEGYQLKMGTPKSMQLISRVLVFLSTGDGQLTEQQRQNLGFE